MQLAGGVQVLYHAAAYKHVPLMERNICEAVLTNVAGAVNAAEAAAAVGARSFVFEGRECGGHVGPLSSFVLWDTMIEILLEELSPQEIAKCRVLFAGGIHDGPSAAMVSASSGGENRPWKRPSGLNSSTLAV